MEMHKLELFRIFFILDQINVKLPTMEIYIGRLIYKLQFLYQK